MTEPRAQGEWPQGESGQGEWIRLRADSVRRALGAPPIDALGPAPAWSGGPLAPFLDHTLLKPEATRADVLRLAEEARAHRLAGACVNLWHARAVCEALKGSDVKTVVVVGFPLGATSSVAKAAETHEAVLAGASEIDVVLNIGAVRSGLLAEARDDLAAVVRAAEGRPVKVILETHLLSFEERVDACVLSELAQARWLKTSTGFSGGGATIADVLLMRRAVGDRISVKASGGIRTAEGAVAMLRAGAQRLGTSSSLAILSGAEGASFGY